MLDLPELPEPTNRKLVLQWNTLLDKHGLAGEHLHWHASERERLRRVAAQMGPVPGHRWRGVDLGEQAVDEVGIAVSVEVAKKRFKDLCGEYWLLWQRSGNGHEVFADWLDILKQQTSGEVASVWKGGKAIDRWYKRACAPAVEKSLADLVKKGTNRARGAEIKRLGTGAPQKGDSHKSADAEPPIIGKLPTDGCVRMDGANPANSAGEGRKRGPKADLDAAERVAEIVARVAPNMEWRPKEYAIREELDKAGIPCPTVWLKRDRGCKGWADQTDRSTAVKAIEYRLHLAKQRKKPAPETLS
jgi:hypothetical protein